METIKKLLDGYSIEYTDKGDILVIDLVTIYKKDTDKYGSSLLQNNNLYPLSTFITLIKPVLERHKEKIDDIMLFASKLETDGEVTIEHSFNKPLCKVQFSLTNINFEILYYEDLKNAIKEYVYIGIHKNYFLTDMVIEWVNKKLALESAYNRSIKERRSHSENIPSIKDIEFDMKISKFIG